MEVQRQRVLDELTRAWSADSLDMEAYEQLVEEAQRATRLEELDRLMHKIGATPPAPLNEEIPADKNGAASRPPEQDGTGAAETEESPRTQVSNRIQQSTCILCSREYRGDWLNESILADTTILGSTVYDFRDCWFPSKEIRLEVMTALGSVEIIVPKGVAVRMDAVPVLGEAAIHKSVTTRAEDAKALLIVSGSIMLGSVQIKCK